MFGMKEKKIEVLAGHSQSAVLDHQADIVMDVDSIKEGKERAKYYVSGDYERYLGADAGEPMLYAQVRVDGEVHSDYYAKGYNGRRVNADSGEVVAA